MNGVVFSATMVPLTSGIGIFTGLLPDLKDVRRATRHDESVCHDLRVGETTAALIVLSLGAVGSYFTKSPIPLVTALIVCVALVCMYESVLHITPPERKMA